MRSLPVRHPYLVGSRRSDRLLERLAADPHPILFEGLHTCADLGHPSLKDKRKFVMHAKRGDKWVESFVINYEREK